MPPSWLKSPPWVPMGSVHRKPAGDLVLLFDDDMYPTVQVWKSCPKRHDEFLKRLTPTDRLNGAGSKEMNVIRQNLVRDFESALAH